MYFQSYLVCLKSVLVSFMYLQSYLFTGRLQSILVSFIYLQSYLFRLQSVLVSFMEFQSYLFRLQSVLVSFMYLQSHLQQYPVQHLVNDHWSVKSSAMILIKRYHIKQNELRCNEALSYTDLFLFSSLKFSFCCFSSLIKHFNMIFCSLSAIKSVCCTCLIAVNQCNPASVSRKLITPRDYDVWRCWRKEYRIWVLVYLVQQSHLSCQRRWQMKFIIWIYM